MCPRFGHLGMSEVLFPKQTFLQPKSFKEGINLKRLNRLQPNFHTRSMGGIAWTLTIGKKTNLSAITKKAFTECNQILTWGALGEECMLSMMAIIGHCVSQQTWQYACFRWLILTSFRYDISFTNVHFKMLCLLNRENLQLYISHEQFLPSGKAKKNTWQWPLSLSE